jgi:hypothetical protein
VNRTLAFVLLRAGQGGYGHAIATARAPLVRTSGAEAIFLDRVEFTNDEFSGTFLQTTLVRFDIEEVFKVFRRGPRGGDLLRECGRLRLCGGPGPRRGLEPRFLLRSLDFGGYVTPAY